MELRTIDRVRKIAEQELKDVIIDILEIVGLGVVNNVYDVRSKKNNYIFRYNESSTKKVEFIKEQWCLGLMRELGVLSPKVSKVIFGEEDVCMIQEKINGISGERCNPDQRQIIWKNLGAYAQKFHQIERIENEEVVESEFHNSWKARLTYNIKELSTDDSLLEKDFLSSEEHIQAREVLDNLVEKDFKEGLVHGDLSLRNVIWQNGDVYLLDWGTAEINVVPHHEFGLLLMSNELTEREFQLFLESYGISKSDYSGIADDIRALNLLHRLDKYRWAEEYDDTNLEDYAKKIKTALNQKLLK